MDSTNNSPQKSWFSGVYETIDRTLSRALGTVRQHLLFFHVAVAVAIYLSAEFVLSHVFHVEVG